MRVRDLKVALAQLPPDLDDSTVIVTSFSQEPVEATRLILVPELTGVYGCASWKKHPNAVWVCDGGPNVSNKAIEEGWSVPYYNPVVSEGEGELSDVPERT